MRVIELLAQIYTTIDARKRSADLTWESNAIFVRTLVRRARTPFAPFAAPEQSSASKGYGGAVLLKKSREEISSFGCLRHCVEGA